MYNVKARYGTRNTDGGVAQLARASGSYPAGRRFKSHRRYHSLDERLEIVKTISNFIHLAAK